DGPLSPLLISNQVHGEGVRRIVVVTDEPEKYPSKRGFAPGTEIRHRRDLDRVKRTLRETPGVSVLIYDQTCAAEKRRRRKRGEMADPLRRVFINHRVCEGCGDCSQTSNCLSVLPLQTAYGRKRVIDQSSCNKDYTCADGLCPSFVRVVGATPRRAGLEQSVPREVSLLPEPVLPTLKKGESYNILVTGIGGTGVVTIAALLTMGAHLENKVFSTIDQFGMAQKGGAVSSHIRLTLDQDDLGAVRLSTGAANLVLGCDSLVTADEMTLDVIDPEKTRVVVNTHRAITGQFALDPDLDFPEAELLSRIEAETGAGMIDSFNATRLATALLGDSIGSNLFMLGFAYQKGLIPVSAEAIEKAVELNALAVEMNKAAFLWGRRAAHDLAAVENLVSGGASRDDEKAPQTLDEVIAHRAGDLAAYQNTAYAKRYETLVRRVQSVETERTAGRNALTEAVAFGLHKLMAYKDEYEVARLYADPSWRKQVEAQFEGIGRLELLLAPPLIARPDPKTGQVRKRAYGPWIFPFLRLLAKGKRLRGTLLDIFGHTAERRSERELIGEYEAILEELMHRLNHDNHPMAVEIAGVSQSIRGFGSVKTKNIATAREEWKRMMALWRADSPLPMVAE
ncbi:MAG: DUF6537 domain-containing protein, partial [bacterium]